MKKKSRIERNKAISYYFANKYKCSIEKVLTATKVNDVYIRDNIAEDNFKSGFYIVANNIVDKILYIFRIKANQITDLSVFDSSRPYSISLLDKEYDFSDKKSGIKFISFFVERVTYEELKQDNLDLSEYN